MEPDMVGASVYDAFQVLFAAFENVGTDPAAMRDYIAGLKDFDTVTGYADVLHQRGFCRQACSDPAGRR